MKGKNIKLQIVLLVVFVVLATVLFFLLDSRKKHNQQQHLQLITERYQRAYNTIYDQYKQLSANLYSGIMKRYNVQDVYQKLLTANEEQKSILRAELLARIRPRYEELKKTGSVRQLHFHLKDNESFLRLHRPEKYGDNLTGIRETVNYVNTKYSPVDGFEEGRIFNGYRFVFPITAADQTHLGSMEISFGPEAMTFAMMKQYFVLSNFFIKEMTVKNKLFPGELEKNYRKSHHNGYLYDKNVLEALKKVSRKEMKDLKPQKAITDIVYANAHSGQAMSLYDSSINIVITTIPVVNPVTHEMIAIFTVRSQPDFFINEIHHFRLVFSLILLLLCMILSTFYMQHSKRKILEFNTKHLEEQVRLRTTKLTAINESLENEIDERKQVEEALRIERDNLNIIFEAMEDGIYIVNQQYDIQYANQTLQKEFGSYEGQKCYEYLQDRKEVCPWCKNKEVFKGKAVRWEWYSTKNKKTYDLIDTPLKNSDGSISKLEIFRDITERKQAEKALLASESRFRHLVNELPSIAVQGYDSKRMVVFWNDASVKLYGYTAQEAFGRKLEDLIIPEPMKEAVIEGIRDWYENNVAIPSSEITLCRKDGSEVIVYSSHIMQVDPQGKKIMYCVDVDLTEQKHAQEAVQILMRSTVGLTGQAYFDLVVQELCRWTNVDSANIGVLTPDDRVDAIALQLDGKMIKNFIYPLAGSPCVEVINKGTRVYPENVCHLFPNDEELTELNAQGYAGVPIMDSKGEPLGIMWMVSRRPMHLPSQWQAVMEIIAARTGAEIERLHAEKEKQKATEQMLRMQKLESVGVLAGGIAHDFNNILSAILGNIELASLRIENEDAELASLLSNAQKATNRAAKLTNQLLTFSKGGDPIKGVSSLPEIITESADFVLHGSRISCHYIFPDDLWMVDVDSGQISQVIQNIVLNAKYATPKGGIITVECANMQTDEIETIPNMAKGNFVRITIEDTGVGVPEEIISKVFDPYFTTNDKSSGLGLAICYSIISKHDGHITIQSQTGKGTILSIYLPASPSTGITVAKQQKALPAMRPLLVMVMDDEEMIRDLAQMQLSILGHEVVLVADGEEAINKYQELKNSGTPVDLVIMDLTIPGGMGGKEASKKLLQIDPEAKVIVASGYSNDPLLANYREYGLYAAVAKPFDLDILKKAIEDSFA